MNEKKKRKNEKKKKKSTCEKTISAALKYDPLSHAVNHVY